MLIYDNFVLGGLQYRAYFTPHICNVSVVETMENLSSHAGFVRAWIRLSFNDGAMCSVLSLLSNGLYFVVFSVFYFKVCSVFSLLSQGV